MKTLQELYILILYIIWTCASIIKHKQNNTRVLFLWFLIPLSYSAE